MTPDRFSHRTSSYTDNQQSRFSHWTDVSSRSTPGEKLSEMSLIVDEMMHDDLATLRSYQDSLFVAVDQAEAKNLEEHLNDLQDELDNTCVDIRAELVATRLSQIHTSEERALMIKHQNVTRKFLDFISAYSASQARFKDRQLTRLQRQYRCIYPDASDDQLRQLGCSVDDTHALFADNILQNDSSAVLALEEAKNQHNDILYLEKSIWELGRMILEMSEMVTMQGEVIGNIEILVHSADHDTNTGKNELKKAVVGARTMTRRKKYLIAAGVILLILILSLITAYVIIPAVNASKKQEQ